ncbi:hypothetical protein Tco_0557378 [Tanacetum coccineum]
MHQPPQETSVEILQAKEDLMKSIQTFLKNEELSEYINCPSWNRPTFYDNDDKEYSIQFNEYLENSSKAITHDLPTEEPEYSLSMGDEHFSTIPEIESDEVIKSSVKNLIPILREPIILHEKLLNIDLPIACDSLSSDDFSSIRIFDEKSVTLSNPFFDSNEDFTSSDDESLSDEDVPEDNIKIYSNPLFEFDDGYISSDVNPLFDEMSEDIKCKDSYDSNLDESTFLVTSLSDSNKDECFTPCDDVELLLHHDPSIIIISILERFTNELPLEKNDDLFDLESKEDD